MRKFLVGAVLVCVSLGGVSTASAVTIPVNTTVDTPLTDLATCSLRQAVIAANYDAAGSGSCEQGTGDDVIQLPTGTYVLNLVGTGEAASLTGDLDVNAAEKLTIEPAGSGDIVTIDGNRTDRIFDHTGTGELTIRNLSLVRGEVAGPETGNLEGGAIRNANGSLALQSVLLFDNRSGLDGGAILNNGELSIVNSTISTNQASRGGGGIFNTVAGSASVRSSTITLNRADANKNGTGGGGGLRNNSATVFNLTNSILADNFDDTSDDSESSPDCASLASFFPRYVISTQRLGTGDCLVGDDPRTNFDPVDPRLKPLDDNVGQTFTHALPMDSPAIDAGGSDAPDRCPAADQRGVVRPDDACDIGAYEYDENILPAEPLPGLRQPSNTVATFDGVNLHIRLNCPARFKPKCISTAMPVTAKRNGRPMAAAKLVKTPSNRWKRVSFRIKPAFRARVEAMTFVDRKNLIVKQRIRAKRVRGKKAKRPAIVIHAYKVRAKL